MVKLKKLFRRLSSWKNDAVPIPAATEINIVDGESGIEETIFVQKHVKDVKELPRNLRFTKHSVAPIQETPKELNGGSTSRKFTRDLKEAKNVVLAGTAKTNFKDAKLKNSELDPSVTKKIGISKSWGITNTIYKVIQSQYFSAYIYIFDVKRW